MFSDDEKPRLRLRSALYVVDLVRFRQVRRTVDLLDDLMLTATL